MNHLKTFLLIILPISLLTISLIVFFHYRQSKDSPCLTKPYLIAYEGMTDREVAIFNESAEEVCQQFNQTLGYRGWKSHELLTGTHITVNVYEGGDECFGAAEHYKTCVKRVTNDPLDDGNTYRLAIYRNSDLWYKCAVKHEFAHLMLYELEKKSGLTYRSVANGEADAITTANERHHLIMEDKRFSRLYCTHLFK